MSATPYASMCQGNRLEGHLFRYFAQLTKARMFSRTLAGKSAEHRNDVTTSFKWLEVAQRALTAAKEDYQKSLEEMRWAEAAMKSANNDVSLLTALVQKVGSLIRFIWSRTAEELRDQAAVDVNKV